MKNFLIRIGDAVHWYPKGITTEEKVLIFKIDLLVLVYACLAFFTKYLDISALSKCYSIRKDTGTALIPSQQMHTSPAWNRISIYSAIG
jgi:hypothetical protein